jgi:hypothetical protein
MFSFLNDALVKAQHDMEATVDGHLGIEVNGLAGKCGAWSHLDWAFCLTSLCVPAGGEVAKAASSKARKVAPQVSQAQRLIFQP